MIDDVLQQPTARTFKLDDLVKLVLGGRIRVPHFQRDFRWDARDVLRLFDSIFKGYPVGSVLLWRRPADAQLLKLGALEIDAPASDEAFWVVDGQQRITSLVNALSASAYEKDERFRLDYNLADGRIEKGGESDSENSIPLPVLFDLRKMLLWSADHTELVLNVNDIAARIREFELPASIVAQADREVLQDIFDRMNNAGKRLRRAEIFSAIFSPDENSIDDRLTISGIAERVEYDCSFGRVDDDTVLQVILARRGSNVTREVHREFGDPLTRRSAEFTENRDTAYEEGEKALRLAIAFLQRDAGVPHFAFLPYRYLLTVLARFFAHFPEPEERNRELLTRWFWRAALAGPEIFKGSATGAVRSLASRITPGEEIESVQALLESVTRKYPQPLPDLRNFRTTSSATRVSLCALWELGPKSFQTGNTYSFQEIATQLDGQSTALEVAFEAIPRGLVPASMRPWTANRMILIPDPSPEQVREAISRRGSLFKLAGDELKDLDGVLASHLIDQIASDLLANGDQAGFLMHRAAQLDDFVGSFLVRKTGESFEDTPPLSSLDLDDEIDRDDMSDASR